MTREDFLDQCRDWDVDDYARFAIDNELSLMEDLVSSGELDDVVCEDLRDATHNINWTSIRYKLDDIEDGYSWYSHNDELDFSPLDEDWFYSAILSEMDDNELWEEDEEDEDDDEFGGEPFHDPEEDRVDEVQRELSAGVFSVDAFLESSSGDMQVLRTEAEEADRIAAEAESLLKEMAGATADSRPEPAPPAQKFCVGDEVRAADGSDSVYGVTNKGNHWKGIVREVRANGLIRVYGSGDRTGTNEFTVESRWFELVPGPEPADENIEDLWRW